VSLGGVAAGGSSAVGTLSIPAYVVRAWNGDKLVAEGSRRTPSGPVTMNAVNASGASGTLELNYTGDVALGDAWLVYQWPASYKIFYSQLAIDYSSQPQATITDNGGNDYRYISPSLPSGEYLYNIVPVDDEGDPLSSPVDLGPVSISGPPAAAVITNVAQPVTGALRLYASTPAGTKARLYISGINDEVDFTSPISASSTNPLYFNFFLPSVTTEDREPAYNSLASTWDAAVDIAVRQYLAYNVIPFVPSFVDLTNAVEGAVASFASSTGYPLTSLSAELTSLGDVTFADFGAIAGLSGDAWAQAAAPLFNRYLQTLGLMLSGEAQRYKMVDGSVQQPGFTGKSLLDTVTPFKKPNILNAVVRSAWMVGTFTIPDYTLISGITVSLTAVNGGTTFGPYTWKAGTDYTIGSSNDQAATNLASAINATLSGLGTGCVAVPVGNVVQIVQHGVTITLNSDNTGIVPGDIPGLEETNDIAWEVELADDQSVVWPKPSTPIPTSVSATPLVTPAKAFFQVLDHTALYSVSIGVGVDGHTPDQAYGAIYGIGGNNAACAANIANYFTSLYAGTYTGLTITHSGDKVYFSPASRFALNNNGHDSAAIVGSVPAVTTHGLSIKATYFVESFTNDLVPTVTVEADIGATTVSAAISDSLHGAAEVTLPAVQLADGWYEIKLRTRATYAGGSSVSDDFVFYHHIDSAGTAAPTITASAARGL
jgi:hypothetical protein